MDFRCVFAGALAGYALMTGTAAAVPLDPAFSETVQQTGLDKVTGMAWAPDGSDRLFLITKTGEIRIIEAGVLLDSPFATIAPVQTSSECGLVGMAFHPSFATNGYLYVFVTVSLTEQRILRLTANGNVGEDERIIVANLPTVGANHDGGGLGIGRDGKLYWAIGDNGNLTGVNADLASLAAKVGRANLDGSLPDDNPFHDGEGPNNDYIWARGFRNPFTLTFQPSTERIWVNTVGTVYEQIFTPEAGDDAGYDKYEGNQIAGFLAPTILYRTRVVDQRGVQSVTRAGGVATYKTLIHRFQRGTKITITGVADPSFNTTAFVASIPTPTTFTLTQPGPDATSTGGSITGFQWGSAVTGGAFWDSSGAPATHVGDFFTGDYVSGKILRAELGDGIVVDTVDEWANGIASAIDIDVGPNGNLYYIGHHGELYQTRYNGFTAQALVVSRLHLRTFEGGATAFNVRLAIEPSTNRTVTIERADGDSDVGVTEGETLTFTPANWDQPQRVVLRAERDADLADDEATISVSSTDAATQTVRVRITDDGPVGDLGGGGAGGENTGEAAAQGGTPSETEGGEGAVTADGGAPGELGGAPSGSGAGSNGGAPAGGAPPSSSSASDDSSCGCRAAGAAGGGRSALAMVLSMLGAALLRRQRRLVFTASS